MAVDTLTAKRLNRATLARQMLLAREKVPIVTAVERLLALQAQLARPPFLALWSRVAGFERTQLTRLLASRKIVRATAFRATLHLLSSRDFAKFRAAMQPALTRAVQSILRTRLKDVDQTLAAARRFFAEPRPFDDLRRALSGDVRAAAYAVRCLVPLVQVPNDGPWSFPPAPAFTLAESWLGRKLPADDSPRELVLRYLSAFGPATPADVQAFTGLPSLRETFAELRPKLRSFRDEDGRELFDLAKAPRPPESTPAPPRLLPDFDSLVLAHDDRSRLIDPHHRPRVSGFKNLQVLATFLVDGRVAGTWKIQRSKRVAQLKLSPFDGVARAARAALVEEAAALVRFAEPDAQSFDVAVD